MSVDPDLVDMMGAVFAEYAHDPKLWQRLDELGLVRLTGAEEHGGSGAGWFEAAELLSAAARHGARIPLAEHDLLACWLLESSGLAVDGAVRTVCMLDKQGRARDVPWADTADRVVVVWRGDGGFQVADVAAEELTITPGANLIGEPRDEVAASLTGRQGVQVGLPLVTQLRLKSGLVRAIQVCAALDQILQLSIEHVSSRIQFGRPLSKFQAVQNLVSDIAAEAALARAATEAALAVGVTSDWAAENLEFLVAVARSCAGHAASVVVRNAHQVHGAIGTTREHRLHEFTRAALAWRSEFGSVRYWDDQVTDSAMYASAGGLWGLITGS
ncbi:acyl-CoA dehydrogenase [Mycobacterium kiyosense]|uniref:Acyl-CoA dehydrogenase n=1 Tax=Mycobacterium kiyosense TaxID=2871094 RepID=A0A9P3Q7E4_9MYCO|nr:acyl-CoA dehydrogenase family protein [Mycobacterium kiyosense]GLB82250.1 acyl-CoA dehydrogenase [Mycobacterium kiyosense]GLB95954.1 acyl-CoA dehydrogenase [Mycobacterium kiyosense]GLD30037.1 acyl-CoA dehydrogenase [Mycobacterium kiyosense]GLD35726.1 acyl-CoA dehydrogenase [Mycobacterium kiyosense]GLD42192.1 acyl-CoA dehydrogenase [Mycobacterium kiyosense]